MMRTHWVFNGCDDTAKAQFQSQWEKKWPRIEKLIATYPPDLQGVVLTVHMHPHRPNRDRYDLKAVIPLSTGTLAAETTDQPPLAAVDLVADKIVAELKRHKDQVRKDYLFKRKTRRHAELTAAQARLDQQVEAGRKDDFFQLLQSRLKLMRDHASRELKVLEQEGKLHRGEMTVDDVLDEVVTRAWSSFRERPQQLSLELWLTELLHQTLDDWISDEPRPHATLDEPATERRPDEAPQVDDQEWWTWLLGEDETETLEDVIPDREHVGDEDQAEKEDLKERVLSLLGELPAAHRQAFLLNALEDFDPAEIALLQERPVSEVQADIEAARRRLRERLRTNPAASRT